jgi:hypothetical protein
MNLTDIPRLAWLQDQNVRPFVFVRKENRILRPGSVHKLDWFTRRVVYKNPLCMSELNFGNAILELESQAFGPAGMAMPRWVFFDCALVPGFVAGFAKRTSKLTLEERQLLKPDPTLEWTPLSLFIIIPTMSREGEWVAHNLCTVNSLLPESSRYYGLGFLSKAFGLWYANVKVCCGFSQWGNPAIKLHAHYGDFQILTAYTPIHSHAETFTYRAKVNPSCWIHFFTKEPMKDFESRFQEAGFVIDPKSEASMKSFQQTLEDTTVNYYLNSREVISQSLDQPLKVYIRRDQA